MRLESLRLILLAATSLSLAAFTPARAADAAASDSASDSGAVEKVVITARHRAENLQDVPITVSAVSGSELESQHFDRVEDYASKLPNFYAIQQNTRVSTLTIRGVGGNANSDGSEAGVGVIVDNVFYTHPGFTWLDFTDLDHIELAKGPQGTLLGKNTTLGALIVTTQKPSFTPQASASLTAGDDDLYSFRANVSGPVVADKLAARVTLYRETQQGWVNNAYNAGNGDKLLDTNRWAARGQLLFQGGDNFSDRLIADHFDSNEFSNFYGVIADPNYANGAPRTSWSSKLEKYFGYTPALNAPDNANLNSQGRALTHTDGLSNEADWKHDGFGFASITAWRRLYFRPHNDMDLSPFPIFAYGYDVDVNQYSQELRVASPTGGKLDYQAGFYFLREDVHSNFREQFSSDASTFFLSPLLPASVLNGLEVDELGVATTYSEAFFAQGSYHFTDKFQITFGARATDEQKQASDQGSSFGGAALTSPTLLAYRGAVAGAPFLVSARKSSVTPSLLFNPSYKLTDDTLLYLSLSHGEKSGAANLGALPATLTTKAQPVIISPEKSNDFELGVKNKLLDGRATLNLNYYNDDITDYQATLVPTTGAPKAYLANVGEVRLEGIEAESSLSVNPWLDLTASASDGRSTYVSYKNAPVPVEYSYAGGPTYLHLSGTQVPNASKFTGNISAEFHHPISEAVTVFGYLNESYKSGWFTSAVETLGRQGGYGLTNAGFGFKSAGGRYSLEFWGKNLFDKQYATAFSPATASTPYFEVFGRPRTVGVTLTVKGF